MYLLLTISAASASPGYPAEINSYLGIGCDPQCTICHATNSGGDGTVVQDFGKAMMDNGLTGGSSYDKLHTALDALANGSDPGATYIVTLTSGADPNTGTSFCDAVTPTYGFGCASAPELLGGAGFAGAGLGLAFALGRRRAG